MQDAKTGVPQSILLHIDEVNVVTWTIRRLKAHLRCSLIGHLLSHTACRKHAEQVRAK